MYILEEGPKGIFLGYELCIFLKVTILPNN